jgi:hypothetical protein
LKFAYFIEEYITNSDCQLQAIQENSTDDETERLSELVLSKIEETTEPDWKEKLPKANIWKLPELSYGKNPEVPSFSSAINLVHSKELGRHVLANRNINTGIFLILSNIISLISDTYP